MCNKLSSKGFTLIELLIVVAIIAILAAIAVPNFLEAQVRSKVARVHSDMRSLATAIESYYVDHNSPPLGRLALVALSNAGEVPAAPAGYNKYSWFSLMGLATLTTPVAYINSIPRDPFTTDRGQDNFFYTFQYADFMAKAIGNYGKKPASMFSYTWALQSWGPYRKEAPPTFLTRILTGTGTGGEAHAVYDATNGTKSLGTIIRTNKGIFTGVPGN